MSMFPITTTCHSTITVIPSKRLCKVIGTILPECTAMPPGIRKLYSYDGQTVCCPQSLTVTGAERSTYSKYDVQFTDEEYRSIRRYLNEQSEIPERETFGFSYPPHELDRAASQVNASQIRLDLNDLKWLHDTLAQMRGKDTSVPYFHSLLADCCIVLPDLPSQDYSSVCSEVDRGHTVRKEVEVEEEEEKQMSVKCQRMTKTIDSARKAMLGDIIGFPVKHVNRHLLAVAQFVCSVAAGFAFGFIGIELLVGQLDFGFRLLLGVMIGLIVALSEIYFLAQKLNEDDDVSLPSAHPTLQSMAKSTQKTHQD